MNSSSRRASEGAPIEHPPLSTLPCSETVLFFCILPVKAFPGQGVRTTFVRLRSPRRRYRQHEVLTRSRRFFAQQCLPERSACLSIACNIHRARLNCLVTSCAPLLNRSRRKKYDKAKQGRTGVKVKRGSHLDASSASPATQCALCDKGQHRSCAGLAHCTARKRSPPGINKRKEGALGA